VNVERADGFAKDDRADVIRSPSNVDSANVESVFQAEYKEHP
jgi:hypothetical protein